MGNLNGAGGDPPDDTQGIARVEFKNGHRDVKTLPACAVCLPKGDETYMNMLGLSSNERSKYYVIGPWFEPEVRPAMETYNDVTVKFHRFQKPAKYKEISVELNRFKEFESSNSFVIATNLGRNVESSTFLKKWSSKVVFCKTPSDICEIYKKASIWAIKKDDKLLKYTKIKIIGNAQAGFTFKLIEKNMKYSLLVDCGLILISGHKTDHYKVIGCYKKGLDSEIQLSCLHSRETLLVKVAPAQPPPQPPPPPPPPAQPPPQPPTQLQPPTLPPLSAQPPPQPPTQLQPPTLPPLSAQPPPQPPTQLQPPTLPPPPAQPPPQPPTQLQPPTLPPASPLALPPAQPPTQPQLQQQPNGMVPDAGQNHPATHEGNQRGGANSVLDGILANEVLPQEVQNYTLVKKKIGSKELLLYISNATPDQTLDDAQLIQRVIQGKKETPERKPPECKKCGKPMKGHKRAQCD